VGLYSFISPAKGPAHRKFNCVVTCFFIDTSDELIDYILTIDGLLEEVYISMYKYIAYIIYIHTCL